MVTYSDMIQFCVLLMQDTYIFLPTGIIAYAHEKSNMRYNLPLYLQMA